MNEIIKAIEGSELWINVNKAVKKVCNKNNIELDGEQYEAIRNMMLSKVIMEDEDIMNAYGEKVYNELRK